MTRKYAILFTILVAVQFLLLVYYMNIRTALFCDEVWSYGMANSYDSPYLYEKGFKSDYNDSFYNHWVEGKRFFEYITVQPQERFAYQKVYDNQMADLHPPLYYYLLHTICSFFPDTFNRWYGQIICLIAFIFAQFVLYKLAKQFFKNDNMALLMCAFYGFSMAAVNDFIYIRMYCLVTLWYLCITYFSIKICEANQISTKDGWWLFLFGFLGFMTHNHFAIYYLCLCIGCGICFIARKNYSILGRFACLAMLSFVAYFAIFPGIFKQATNLGLYEKCGGIPGPFPIQALLAYIVFSCNYSLAFPADKLFSIASGIVKFIGEDFAYCPVWLFLIVGAVIEAFCVIKQKITDKWLILIYSICSYYVILSSYTFLFRNGMFFSRYLFSILPCFAMLSFGIIYKLIYRLKAHKWYKAVFIILILSISLGTHFVSAREWCFDTPPNREEITERLKGASIIYIMGPSYTTDPLIHGKCQDFMYAKKVFTSRLTDVECVFQAVKECDPNDRNLVILPVTEEGYQVFSCIKKLINKEPAYLFTDITSANTFYVLQI